MSRLACLLVVALAFAAPACVTAQATGEPGGPALAPPDPPPHTVIPVEIPEKPAAEPASSAPKSVIVDPSLQPPVQKAEKSVAKPPDAAAAPPQPVAPPPPPLQTTTDVTGEETAIRAQMTQARANLKPIEYGALSAEQKTQYDTAQRFLQQAEDALKVKNLVFARQLADKAVTLAAALVKK
jgi:hypothetical protein